VTVIAGVQLQSRQFKVSNTAAISSNVFLPINPKKPSDFSPKKNVKNSMRTIGAKRLYSVNQLSMAERHSVGHVT